MKRIFLLLLLIAGTTSLIAQPRFQKKKLELPPAVCYASGKVEKSFIPTPSVFQNHLKSGTEKKSDIVVTYSLFPENVKQAFEYAVGIWETIIESPVPIYMRANWRSQDENTLGSCAPYEEFYADFEDAPHQNLYYPIAIAEKITKAEITDSNIPDITATFNKEINWYFGTDGKTPDSLYDFVSVVLHEIGHGLGFYGFFLVDDSQGIYGYYNYGDVSAFDNMVVKRNGDYLVDTTIFDNQSAQLKTELTSEALYINSPTAITDNGGSLPRLFAPAEWDDGSSVYHLNEGTYITGNLNSLMTPFLGKGEAIHDPGPITTGIMADIGWKHLYIAFEQLKDIEEIKPLVFNVKLESDYELDSAALFVVYSDDNFASRDSIPLVAGNIPGLFSAELLPSPEPATIHYFIQAGDIKNRVFTMPANAPEQFYSVKIGPDSEPPVISHHEIPFYLINNEDLPVSATVIDNIGVDTVYVEYSINGIVQTPFGLVSDTENLYSGYFNFNKSLLNDGDVITYNVVAKDASIAQNSSKIPDGSVYSFKAENLFDPILGYLSDFNNTTNDFVIKDFEVYTADNFENGALHSPHPYLSPNQDDATIDYVTILKYPVILKENGTMSFDEVVLVEPGEVGAVYGDDDFWDYVIVEGSKDFGKTWLQVTAGYDSGTDSVWLDSYNDGIINMDSRTNGSAEMYINRKINLLQNGSFSAGDTVLFRFRLYSDPYAHGWGWAIDNLRIQTPVSSPRHILSSGNISIYPNPFDKAITISLLPKSRIEKIEIEIYNIDGQKIRTDIFTNLNHSMTEKINLAGIGAGVYFVSVKENGTQVYSQKVIKM